jgi:hypothetical protein
LITPDKWYSLTVYVKLNSFKDGVPQADGITKTYLYADGKELGFAQATGVKFRSTDHEASLIHNVFFSTFYGGNEHKRVYSGSGGGTWEPKLGAGDLPNVIYFDNFAVYAAQLGPDGKPLLEADGTPLPRIRKAVGL